jgi:hypothetical protein
VIVLGFVRTCLCVKNRAVVVVLIVVQGFGFGRCDQPESVYESAGVVIVHRDQVMASRSARRVNGPLRNGESARIHSVLYSPIVVPSIEWPWRFRCAHILREP